MDRDLFSEGHVFEGRVSDRHLPDRHLPRAQSAYEPPPVVLAQKQSLSERRSNLQSREGFQSLEADPFGEADWDVEWGAESALARDLLAAALTDVAPSGVRDRVMGAVDVVLREMVEPARPTDGAPTTPAFSADAAPVTTLSGVFEKRRASADSASCTEPVLDAFPAGATSVGSANAASRDAMPCSPITSSPVTSSPVADQVRQPIRAGETTQRLVTTWGAATAVPGEKPLVTGVGPPHCHGGPMLGRRCRSAFPTRSLAIPTPDCTVDPRYVSDDRRVQGVSHGGPLGGPVVSSPVVSSPVVSSPVVSSPVVSSPVAAPAPGDASASCAASVHARLPSQPRLPSQLQSSSQPPSLALAPGCASSNLDVAFDVSEGHSRLRDSVATGAFNLAQLAAAIVIGIVIGKAAHLVMAEDTALAWSSGPASSEGGLRPEPSRVPGTARSIEAAEPTDLLEAASLEANALEARADEPRAARGAARAAVRARAASRASASRASASRSVASSLPSAPACPLSPGQAVSTLAMSPAAMSPAAMSPALAGVPCATPVATAPRFAGMAPQLRGALALPALLEPANERSRAVASGRASDTHADAPVDDWLGEQLAILARAERGLLEGDPESAVRALDEYQARFPSGLLDPQMGSIRQRVEDRFTAFIFP